MNQNVFKNRSAFLLSLKRQNLGGFSIYLNLKMQEVIRMIFKRVWTSAGHLETLHFTCIDRKFCEINMINILSHSKPQLLIINVKFSKTYQYDGGSDTSEILLAIIIFYQMITFTIFICLNLSGFSLSFQGVYTVFHNPYSDTFSRKYST
jgi:hypothetical protein